MLHAVVDEPEEIIGVVSCCVKILSSGFVMSEFHCSEK